MTEAPTYTGTPWRFHHFGPWNSAVHQEIIPTIRDLPVDEKKFFYENKDRFKWSMKQGNDHLFEQFQAPLPFCVTGKIRRAIRSYGNDTPGLLHSVYGTKPMLRAAPGEVLNFSNLRKKMVPSKTDETPPKKSKKKRDALKKRKAEFRARLEARVSEKSKKDRSYTAPNYDDVFWKGTQELDRIADEPPPIVKGVISIEDSVWKSEIRGIDDGDQ